MIDLVEIAAQLRKPEGEAGRVAANAMNRNNAKMIQAAIDILNLQAGDHVLEIGMGNGYHVAGLLENHAGIIYTGCDCSTSMVQEAEKINDRLLQNGKADFIEATADDIPFEDQFFNKIFCVNVIYFWEDPQKELAEIRRVLKNDGMFAIAIRSKATMEQLPFTKYGFTLYEQDSLVELLVANNFELANQFTEDEILKVGENEIKLNTIVCCFKK